MNKKVVVIGSLNMDFSIHVDKLPKVGETILADGFDLIPGGKGANQAYALGKLGANVSMIGAVGNDEYGRILIDNLKSVNVDTDGIKIIDNEKTGCAFVNVDSNSENNIIVVSGANKRVDKDLIDEYIDKIKEADFIVMQLEIPIETIKYVIEYAKTEGKTIILDPAPAQQQIVNNLDGIDIIKPNVTELEILTNTNLNDKYDIILAGKELLKKGVKNVIVTLGEEGSLLINKEKNKYFEPFKVKAIDSTAAGDSFIAGVTKSLSQGKPLESSIKYGHIVSSYSVTKKGAQTSIPNEKELSEYIYRVKRTLNKEKIIIDADPGVDDAFAIILACKSDELDIDGITTVCGNTNIDNIINNTFKLLDLCDRNDIKVYKGMDISISDNSVDAAHVHGVNGMGGIEFEKIDREVEDISAVDYLIERVNSNPGKITLCALGPLTNIAEAIKKDENFKQNLKKLVIMGGADGIGNITPFAEFNFYKDSIAAKTVFDNLKCEIIVVPLNASYQFPLLLEYEEKLNRINNEVSNFLYDITRESSDYDRRVKKLGGLILNDPLTVLYLLDNSLFDYEYVKLDVVTSGENVGMCEVTKCSNSNIKFIYGIKSYECYKLLFKKIFNIEI